MWDSHSSVFRSESSEIYTHSGRSPISGWLSFYSDHLWYKVCDFFVKMRNRTFGNHSILRIGFEILDLRTIYGLSVWILASTIVLLMCSLRLCVLCSNIQPFKKCCFPPCRSFMEFHYELIRGLIGSFIMKVLELLFPRLFSSRNVRTGRTTAEHDVTYLLFLNRPVAFNDFRSNIVLETTRYTRSDQRACFCLMLIFLGLSFQIMNILFFSMAIFFPFKTSYTCESGDEWFCYIRNDSLLSEPLDCARYTSNSSVVCYALGDFGMASAAAFGEITILISIPVFVVYLLKIWLDYWYGILHFCFRGNRVYSSYACAGVFGVFSILILISGSYIFSGFLDVLIYEKLRNVHVDDLYSIPFHKRLDIYYYIVYIGTIKQFLYSISIVFGLLPFLVNYYLNKPIFDYDAIIQRHRVYVGADHNNNALQEVHNDGEPQEVRNDGEPQEVRNDGEPQEVRNDGEPPEVRNDGEPQEVRNDGEPPEVRNDGEPQEVRNDGEPREVRNDGEPREVRNDGEPQEVRNDGEPQEARNDGEPQEGRNDGEPQEGRNDGEPQEENVSQVIKEFNNEGIYADNPHLRQRRPQS